MFSIIVANWNGEKYIDTFIKSLQNQTYKAFKLYFVDNGSEDKSIERLKSYDLSFEIEIIELSKNTGFAYANNVGINKSMSDNNAFVLTLNNDIELEDNCLQNLSNYINSHQNVQIFQLLMLNYYDHNTIDACGIKFTPICYAELVAYKRPLSELDNFPEKIDGACAGAAAYSKSLLKQASMPKNEYFESKFFAYYEDVDLAMRLNALGASAALVKNALVYHIHSATTGMDSSFKNFYTIRNMHLCLYKNLSKKDFSRFALKYYFTFFDIIIGDVFTGKGKGVFSKLKGFISYFKIRNQFK